MILLSALLFLLWGEHAGGFTFNGDLRHLAVAANTVYISTEERLYQLNHDLTPVQSLTQRGLLTAAERVEDQRFHRVSETDDGKATFRVNILLPFVQNQSLVSCGVIDNHCGYCEVLDLNNISNVRYREQIQVGAPFNSSASVSFLVDVEKTEKTETYILTGTEQYKDTYIDSQCPYEEYAVKLHNTNNDQKGGIFSDREETAGAAIKHEGAVEFVDGFQINLTAYLFSNLPSEDNSNKVRLIWLEGKINKIQTVRSLRGATLDPDDGKGSRLLASSVVPGGPPVLWSGVFSVDGGQTNTVLLLFDISPDLTGAADQDPDFCFKCPVKKGPKTLKPQTVLFRQDNMNSVLAVRQKAWMVFFIGTADGQLIKLAVDKNFHTACPRVLYRANDDRKVFPKIHLDQVDHKHVYLPFRNQVERVPVSKCSTYTTVQDCWSAQDPYCVWCSSKKSCTFEDDCQDSDWVAIPDDSRQQKMISYKVVMDSTGQITLNILTHVTAGQQALSNFACQFSATSSKPCSRESPPQFPQCTCILSDSRLSAEGLRVSLEMRLGATHLLEQLQIVNCSDIRGPPTSVLCQQCIKAGCGWSKNGCSWANHGVENDSVCQTLESAVNFSKPEIFSITPSIVSFYGRNRAVLSGRNLGGVIRVRIQTNMDCTPLESPVWTDGGSLMFHIPSIDSKGVVKVCVLLPDGHCHGNATITYQSSPSCSDIVPNSTWISGKRTMTVRGTHLEFVEGIIHSNTLQEVEVHRNNISQHLTYYTPAAGNAQSSFTSSVSLKVANETLPCPTITYYPDPEFTSFETTWTGDGVLITIQKKADKLEMTPAELTVWGINEDKRYPCIMEEKTNNNKFFICEIQSPPSATFEQLMIMYGDKTVMLGPPSLIHQVLQILRFLLIPCVIIVLVAICQWQKKLTAEMKKY